MKRNCSENSDDDSIHLDRSPSDLSDDRLNMLELQGGIIPVYHLAYISMRISFRDIQTYAGYPSPDNERHKGLDRDSGLKAVHDWVYGNVDCKVYGSHGGKNAFWHAVKFLSEIYFSPPGG